MRLTGPMVFGLSALCGLITIAHATVIVIQGDSTSSAEKGKYTSKGEQKESSDDDVKGAKDYNEQYDGDTRFKADYNIVYKKDGSVDYDKSTVTFITEYYTHQKYRHSAGSKREKLGKSTKTKSDFKTLPIKITDVKKNKDGSVQSFTFESTDWYPPDAPLGKVIVNKGLKGQIDLNNGKASFNAKYQNPHNGVISIYDTTGTHVATEIEKKKSAEKGKAPKEEPVPKQPVAFPLGGMDPSINAGIAIGTAVITTCIFWWCRDRDRPASP